MVLCIVHLQLYVNKRPQFDNAMNEVDFLLLKTFSKLSFQDRLLVKHLGAHQPAHFQLTVGKRSFSHVWFDKYDWLTVSLEKNRLFCFPCILFGHTDALWAYYVFL